MLFKHRFGIVLCSMLAAALAAIGFVVPADHSAPHKVMDGVDIRPGAARVMFVDFESPQVRG